MRRAPVLLLLALGACYDPAFVSGKLRCDETRGADACPRGFSCRSGRCYLDGDGPDCGGPDRTAEPLDGSGGDRDPATADQSQATCPGGGAPVGVAGREQEVYACKGTFARGGAATACGAAYRPCTSRDTWRLSIRECEGAGGFYAADIEGGLKASNMHLICRGKMASQHVLIGCGSEDGTVVPVASDCDPFTTAFPCDQDGVAWSCNGGTKLDSASHSDAAKGGVLCCRR